mgnify:CR=1 FL=1
MEGSGRLEQMEYPLEPFAKLVWLPLEKVWEMVAKLGK